MEVYSTLCPGVADIAGGAGFQVVEIARSLIQHGHEISFLVGDFGQSFEETHEGFRVIRTNKVAHDGSKIRSLLNLVRLLRGFIRANADVYVLRSTRFLAGFCWLFAKLLRKRFVFMIANASNCMAKTNEGAPGPINRLYGLALTHADLVTAQSMDQQAMLKDEFDIDSSLLPNGINTPDTMPSGEPQYDILWVGSLKPAKQPHILINLAKANPDMSFVVAGGPGEDRAYYSRIVSSMNELPNIDFLGFIPPKEVGDVYGRAKLFLNTSVGRGTESLHEGFPNTYLYSWTRGTPTCALHVDPDSCINGNGLGIVCEDTDTLVSDIRELLADDTRLRAMSVKCFEYVNTRHKIDVTAKLFADMVNRI
jgi:glycosyltransferase involved in cell wall biosynthesis